MDDLCHCSHSTLLKSSEAAHWKSWASEWLSSDSQRSPEFKKRNIFSALRLMKPQSAFCFILLCLHHRSINDSTDPSEVSMKFPLLPPQKCGAMAISRKDRALHTQRLIPSTDFGMKFPYLNTYIYEG